MNPLIVYIKMLFLSCLKTAALAINSIPVLEILDPLGQQFFILRYIVAFKVFCVPAFICSWATGIFLPLMFTFYMLLQQQILFPICLAVTVPCSYIFFLSFNIKVFLCKTDVIEFSKTALSLLLRIHKEHNDKESFMYKFLVCSDDSVLVVLEPHESQDPRSACFGPSCNDTMCMPSILTAANSKPHLLHSFLCEIFLCVRLL